jgi:hypothetical protein
MSKDLFGIARLLFSSGPMQALNFISVFLIARYYNDPVIAMYEKAVAIAGFSLMFVELGTNNIIVSRARNGQYSKIIHIRVIALLLYTGTCFLGLNIVEKLGRGGLHGFYLFTINQIALHAILVVFLFKAFRVATYPPFTSLYRCCCLAIDRVMLFNPTPQHVWINFQTARRVGS